jgi:hypothetical protein
MQRPSVFQKIYQNKRSVFLISLILVLGLVPLTWLLAVAFNGLPPEKQVFEDRYATERAEGYQNPASVDELPTPEPNPGFQYPTGIIREGDVPFSSQDYTIVNRWQQMADGDLIIVYAGSLTDDPTQGVVIVGVLPDYPNKAYTQDFLTPQKAGEVSITTAHDFQLALMSAGGTAFLFDVQSRAFKPTITIGIDIKPTEKPNPITLGGTGLLPVAILSSPTFNATAVEPDSVYFGPNGTPSVRSSKEDVNKDGLLDLILFFDNTSTGIAVGDTQACLLGQDNTGAYLSGCDSIVVVPPKK